jgi:hypothetical protein
LHRFADLLYIPSSACVFNGLRGFGVAGVCVQLQTLVAREGQEKGKVCDTPQPCKGRANSLLLPSPVTSMPRRRIRSPRTPRRLLRSYSLAAAHLDLLNGETGFEPATASPEIQVRLVDLNHPRISVANQ